MASVDSGVETENESNDGSFDAKNETQIEQIGLPATVPPKVHSMLSDETVSGIAGCIFGPGLPNFKLPQSSLPPGFGESFEVLPRPDQVACGSGRLEKSLVQYSRARTRRYLRLGRYSIPSFCDSAIGRKLRVAVSSNNIELVQKFLFAGANPNCEDSMGRSPLHLAACSGYADIVRLLLENGANPNQRDVLGNTPLHLATCTNNIVVVMLLLKAGTDVSSSDSHGRSPLQLAESKLKLLQTHMGGDGIVKNYVKNQAFQVSLPKLRLLESLDEIPIYDNAFIAKQAMQIVEMMRLFLQKRGQEKEAEFLSAFSTRLTLSETKEQVENQVRDLLDSLSGLSLSSASEENSTLSPDSSTSSNSIVGSSSAMNVFPNILFLPNSPPPCSFVPSAPHSLNNSFPNSQ